MAVGSGKSDPNVRLIGGGEAAIAIAALAHITAVILMREHFPLAHDIWVALTDLLTRFMAHIVVVIDGHSVAYRPSLSSARIEELRAIYASNRLFALGLIVYAVWRMVKLAPIIRWQISTRLPIMAKPLFWLCVSLFPAIPIAAYGLTRGFADQTFFEFQLGVDLINFDIYYYLDFLLFLLIAWQFLFFLPVAAYFTGWTAYGYLFALRRKAGKRPRPSPPQG